MPEQSCPNCGKGYQVGDEVCRYCGFVFPFSTAILAPGALLHGHYEIQEIIHTGGMGYVYLAKDKNLFDRLCIVKQVKEKIRSEDHLKKLEEEAEKMARLSHPNVATIFDHFVESGFYFLVVERIKGKTLSEIYKDRHGQLKEAEVVKWAIAICEVIIYIHNQGIIHRDITPDNIMLTEEGLIKFIDFGSLREFRYIVSGGTAGIGKYGYAPPEQWQGKPGQRSDIFSLGATIYNLLTGFLPLSRTYQTSGTPQREDLYPQYPPIRTKNIDISIQLEAVLQKALQLDINSRFTSALEMQQALKSLNKEITQPNKGLTPTQKKSSGKSRKYVVVGIIVPLVVLLGVGAFLIRHNMTNTASPNMTTTTTLTTAAIQSSNNNPTLTKTLTQTITNTQTITVAPPNNPPPATITNTQTITMTETTSPGSSTSPLSPTTNLTPTMTNTLTTTPTISPGGGLTLLNSGNSVTDNITYAGEMKWYTFQINAADAIHIVLSRGNNSSIGPWLGLLAPDGSIIFEDYGSDISGYPTGEPIQIDRTLTQKGKYLIRVRGARGTMGSYSLSFLMTSISSPTPTPTSTVTPTK